MAFPAESNPLPRTTILKDMQSRIPDFASEGDQVRHSGYSRSDPVPYL